MPVSRQSVAGLSPLPALDETPDDDSTMVGPPHRSILSTKSQMTWEHEDLAKVRIKVLRGHSGPVNTCKYVHDEKHVLSSSNDLTARLWNTDNGEALATYSGHRMRVVCANVDPSETAIVTGSWDKKIIVWDVETAEELWTGEHPGMVTCCDFSRDGQLVISASDYDHVVRIWDVRIGDVVQEIKDLHTSTITKCMFTPSADRIITTSMDKNTKFYDLKSNITTITLGGHINVVSSCCITHDEKNFATCSWDKTIQIWDVATGTYRSRGGTSLTKGHEGSISSCCFSADCDLLVSGGYDTSVIVWDLDTNAQKIKLMGHEDWVEDVQFNKDATWILSASKDSTIRLWNIADSEDLPLAVDDKKTIGLKVIKCTDCGKPFSMAQLTDAGPFCVFCRLQKRTSPVAIEFEVDPE